MYVMFTHCMGFSSQIFLVSKQQAAERGRERDGEPERGKFTTASSGQSLGLRKEPVKVTALVHRGWEHNLLIFCLIGLVRVST